MTQQIQQAIAKLEETMRSIGVLDFSGEVQLLEWSKSTSRDGPKIKFMMQDDDSVLPFEVATVKKGKMAGQIYHVFAIRVDDLPIKTNESEIIALEPAAKQPNRLAQAMHTDGYFRNSKLWTGMEIAEAYSQLDHKSYVEKLPCCGTKFAKHIACNGDVVGHHVKTSANSGIRIKPPHWYLVPLCHNHHMTWAHGSHAGSATHEDRHDLLLPHAVALTANQMKVKAKKIMGISSLSEITIELLDAFEEEIFGEAGNKYEDFK
ncbi:hypothetical protein [Nitrosomonas ureae]|uniref:Uncharacterized protein n=1 Tax=Nitrosomonas ureae TaxID=44577 RepID=A0A2T5ISS5_9PROT|nr:hypothetical protein [Nitrosomonas ureae]PTQ86887.1 hypothetical protein C8R28_100882 [Nitrosomonas ureae]